MSVILQSGILSQPGAGGGDFDMLSLLPALWLDISDGATLFNDWEMTIPAVVDGRIAKVLDKSGNGIHATGLYPPDGPILRSVGGRNLADTQGDWHTAICSSPHGLFNGVPNAIVIIAWYPIVPAVINESLVFSLSTYPEWRRIQYSASSPSGPYFQTGRTVAGAKNYLGYSATPQITVLRADYIDGTFNYKYHSPGGDYLPGYSGAYSDGAGLSDANGNSGYGLRIGADTSGAVGFGMFGEVACFDYALSPEEELSVVEYMKAKWLDYGSLLTGTPSCNYPEFAGYAPLAAVFDGNFTVAFAADSPDGSGVWIMLDLGAPKQIISARIHAAVGFEARVGDSAVQISSTPDFSSDVLEIARLPYGGVAGWNGYTITPAAAKRYVRVRFSDAPAASSYGHCTELQFYGI